jgi:hypothetical protein
MMSVAYEVAQLTSSLHGLEMKDHVYVRKRTVPVPSASASALVESETQFDSFKAHFVTQMGKEMQNVSSPEYNEINRLLGNRLDKFPLSMYLRMNVRHTACNLFSMSWSMWLPVVAAFVCLMCLHRFFHMGYIRIMVCFSTFLLTMFVLMGYRIKSMIKSIEDGEEITSSAIHQQINTEAVWMNTLQFTLFFVCYGIARTICQPWMWELHFWPVLCLCIVAAISAILFVCFVAPMIPAFCAVMAMPPYVDPVNIEMMLMVSREATLLTTAVLPRTPKADSDKSPAAGAV